MNKLLEEKDEHISHLQEQVSTLEKRLNDVGLSEDDRVKALETEVLILTSNSWVMKCFRPFTNARQVSASHFQGFFCPD